MTSDEVLCNSKWPCLDSFGSTSHMAVSCPLVQFANLLRVDWPACRVPMDRFRFWHYGGRAKRSSRESSNAISVSAIGSTGCGILGERAAGQIPFVTMTTRTDREARVRKPDQGFLTGGRPITPRSPWVSVSQSMWWLTPVGRLPGITAAIRGRLKPRRLWK